MPRPMDLALMHRLAQADGTMGSAQARQRDALRRTMQHGGFGGPPAPYGASPKRASGDVVLEATGSPLLATAAHSIQPGNILRGLGDLGQAAGDYAVRSGSSAGLPPELTGALATGAELIADPTNLIPGGKPAIAAKTGIGALAAGLAGAGSIKRFDDLGRGGGGELAEIIQKKLGEGGSNKGTIGSERMRNVRFRGGRERAEFPGIYGSPEEMVAAVPVAPESENLSRLFDTTRKELSEITLGRDSSPGGWTDVADARAKGLWLPPGTPANPKGSAAAQRIMTPSNENRLVDLWEAARTQRPELYEGMTGWYASDPMYQRMVELMGPEEAAKEFLRREPLVAMASAGSDVNLELNRGTRAAWLANQGRFDEFEKYGGAPGRFASQLSEPELAGLQGHPYHTTAHTQPMRSLLDSGRESKEAKVPSYARAWHPTESRASGEFGFQSHLPVGDAHWSRLVGLADVRKNKAYAQSASLPEMLTLGPWYDQLARQAGLTGVPGQALHWGIAGPQTGVQTPVGAPKLELVADAIAKAARERGLPPEYVRDQYLMGETSIGNIDPSLLMGMGAAGAGAAAAPFAYNYFNEER